eukprot:6196916-Lingulodinium_polyedra.AAC.1
MRIEGEFWRNRRHLGHPPREQPGGVPVAERLRCRPAGHRWGPPPTLGSRREHRVAARGQRAGH